ncbi:hypothetical protein [Winogradskyella ludwigii]|jgi:hypothetical protein|uniref:hypothetical protein n=1 Tax=Winogradskyella ludwigii TaxID=2686076 RepID=UPI0015CE80A5|nr:hypothetical protein [Winogradskyella ludwigii]
MKNLFKIFFVFLMVASCEDTERVTFDGSTAVGFSESIIELSVPVGGVTSTVGLVSTTISSEVRTFDVTVEDSTVESSEYVIGSATIPANSYEGTLDVTLNYDGLEDFVLNSLTLSIDVPGSAFPPVTFSFLKEYDITTFVCGDLKLNIVADNYTSETTWEVADSSGSIVASGGPYDDSIAGTELISNISLAAGDYTFTIYDSYGDGLFDGTNTGTYNLYCAAQTVVSYASGSGNFGASESTDFTIVE